MPSPAASVATRMDGFFSKNSRSASMRFSSDMPPWIVQQWKPRLVSLPTRKSSVSLCSVKTRSRSSRPERCSETTLRSSSNFVSGHVRSVCLASFTSRSSSSISASNSAMFSAIVSRSTSSSSNCQRSASARSSRSSGSSPNSCLILPSFCKSLSRLRRRSSDRRIAARLEARRRWRTVSARPTLRFSACIGPLEVVLDVVGDGIVQLQFVGGELVGQRLDVPGREAGRAVELLHVLLEAADHDAVFVVGAGLGQDVAVDVQVTVEQLQQQGEVVGVALVRRGRQEQEVVGAVPQELAELVPLGLVDLVAVAVRRHLVGFVHDDQIPPHVPQHGSGCRPGGPRSRLT